jgi:hypothetical protein
MATIAILFRNSMDTEKDAIIFNNHYYNEFYYGKKVLSDQEGDLYIHQGEVDVEKLTHFLIKLPELNPDKLLSKFPNIKKIPVNYKIMKGYATEDCIRMILL